MAKKEKDITYEIHKIYGFLSKKHDKVFLRISWNGGDPKDEIRKCWEKDGELKLGKGIEITTEEFNALKALMKEKPKPVDFNAVFESSVGIMAKREAGFRTEDGFTVLRKRTTGIL